MENKSILDFSKILSGIFSNKEQALRNPNKFANIEIHIRPLFFKTFKCYAFYSEQRYLHDIWNPYRQSINILTKKNNIYIISNHDIKNKERFIGGALDLSILKNISQHKSEEKYGCSMHFRENNQSNFQGYIEPGGKCYIKKDQEITLVKSRVSLNREFLISEDSGYAMESGKKVWGSNFGPLVFKKIQDFDKFIDINWK